MEDLSLKSKEMSLSNSLKNAEESEKRKLSESDNGPESGKFKKQKQKFKGMNKNRGPTYRVERESQLCPFLVDRCSDSDSGCSLPGCRFVHDLEQYFLQKLPSLGDECYVFNIKGHCPRGLTCRFSAKHITEGGLNIVNAKVNNEWKSKTNLHTFNNFKHDVLVQLRKRTYNFDKAEKILAQWSLNNRKEKQIEQEGTDTSKSDIANSEQHNQVSCGDTKCDDQEDQSGSSIKTESIVVDEPLKILDNGDSSFPTKIGPVLEDDLFKLRDGEKKKIDWKDKLFLSPLTTVGNLPFRRICKEFGADVTCGEMALAVALLQGKKQEWALTKRHGSEDLFGVQVCGANANVMTRCAQLIQEQTDVDFIDINVGCPIDLIYQQGAGSGLLNKKKVLFSIVKCMKTVLDIPLTVKTRMGVYNNKNVAHNYMKDLTLSGADLITVHGRTKEQRYTKLADWDYIEQCAKLAAPTPLIGNGDILSYEDYDLARSRSPTAAGAMIGRGALIKPWLFTEIKEHRNWDISSSERLEILRRYTNYGLEHWGSDTKGVESTRRFLLEWLSFFYRYIPIGLLEKPPQKMNERPPKVIGRDELEVLMMSHNCADWIKISEILLGPVPDGFNFLPKHKANSWT